MVFIQGTLRGTRAHRRRRWIDHSLSSLEEAFESVELLFNDLKQLHLRRTPLPQTHASIKAGIRNYIENVAPAHLPGFFREAANGRSRKELGVDGC